LKQIANQGGSTVRAKMRKVGETESSDPREADEYLVD
jgi:hypothetical protein